uniref:serine/threonine protein kinase OSK1-like isoform X2 n=1 Tax=Styela clava TaxID=7725 RepID=UPI0019398C3E|nr:serine/threonine protein kinase OSK1-like isoform X2 [Styela clava]
MELVQSSESSVQSILQALGSGKEISQVCSTSVGEARVVTQNVQNMIVLKQDHNVNAANVFSGCSDFNLRQREVKAGNPTNSDEKPNPYDEDTNPFPDFIRLNESIFLNHHEKISKHGEVFKGWQIHDKFGRKQIAVKSLKHNEDNEREAKILVKLCPHSNVANIIQSGVYNTGPIKHIFIAMELCGPQNLTEFVKQKEEIEKRMILKLSDQLINGISHIHKNEVIHRDLKPDNILVSDDGKELKIIDFGLSKEMKSGRSVTNLSTLRVGTDGWRAPETYNADVISKKADIFSMGLVMYFIWTKGCHPFGNDPDDWNRNIKRNQYRDLSKLPNVVEDLVGWMLRFDPCDRPSLKEIQDHKCFYGHLVCPLPKLLNVNSGSLEEELQKQKNETEKAKQESERMKQEFAKKMKEMELRMKKKNETVAADSAADKYPSDIKNLRIIDEQPPNGKMLLNWLENKPLSGYEEFGTMEITYSFPPGNLKVNKGISYDARKFVAYLPDCDEGIQLRDLLSDAFLSGLSFKLAEFGSGKGRLIWGDIPHKSSIDGGPENFGYPDPNYFTQLRQVLKMKGIKGDPWN